MPIELVWRICPRSLRRPRPRLVILSLVAVLGLSVCPSAADEKHALTSFCAEIRATRSGLDPLERATDIPSFALAIAVEDEVVFADSRGFADLEGKVLATPDTRFRMASVSKLLTAATAARLGFLELQFELCSTAT